MFHLVHKDGGYCIISWLGNHITFDVWKNVEAHIFVDTIEHSFFFIIYGASPSPFNWLSLQTFFLTLHFSDITFLHFLTFYNFYIFFWHYISSDFTFFSEIFIRLCPVQHSPCDWDIPGKWPMWPSTRPRTVNAGQRSLHCLPTCYSQRLQRLLVVGIHPLMSSTCLNNSYITS